ncbi:MAG: LysR family transcriptional regulator [Clostridia bacterium]
MDMRQLRYFCTIAREGQITRAAQVLNMAQPPLSQQLKQLENELGVLLFERNGRSMELTESGKLLYRRAMSLLSQLEDVAEEVRETEEGIRGPLSIGAVASGLNLIAYGISEFRRKYPQVTFLLREGDSYKLCEAVKKREIEFAIVQLPLEPQEQENLSIILLPKDSFVCLIPKAWTAELGTAPIRLSALAEHPLLLLRRAQGMGIYEMIVGEYRRLGLVPRIVCECQDASMLLTMVAAGIGATLVPSTIYAAFARPDVTMLTMEELTLTTQSAIVWLRDRHLSKRAQQFIELCQKKFT